MRRYRLYAIKKRPDRSVKRIYKRLRYIFTIGTGVFIRQTRRNDAAVRPDRFNAKCRRVLHAAIMVEIYVANISKPPFPRLCASPALTVNRAHRRTRSLGYWFAYGHKFDISYSTAK